MKSLLKTVSLKNAWPFYLIIISSLIFYWKTIIFGLVPMPADITIGVYYPWLDYKWGYEVGVPVKNPILSDVVSVIYPLRAQAVDIIKSGEIPLWTDKVFAGYPLLANFQIAIFSPTFFLYLLFDKLTAWSFQSVLQPIISSIFMYLLLREMGIKKFSSLSGGLIYSYSGFSIIWQQWNAHALTAAFIPLIILFVIKLSKNISLKNCVFLSFSVAGLIFSGYPQLLVYAVLSSLVWIIFSRTSLYKTIYIAIFGLFGVILSSIQLVPAMELMMLSQRTSEFLIRDLAYLPWYYVVTLVAPDYFGNHVTANFWGYGDYTNTVAYTGIITFTLAIYAIIKSLKKLETRFFFALLSISLILAINNPIADVFYNFNIHGSKAAAATRILVITNLSLAGLFAIGLDLIKEINFKDIIKINLIPTLIILIALIYALQSNNQVGSRNLILPVLLLSLLNGSLFLLIKLKNKTRKNLFIVFISLISILELFRFGLKYLPFVDRDLVFPTTPVIDYLKLIDDDYRLISSDVIPMNMTIPYGIETFSGYDAVYPRWISEYIAAGNANDINASPMTRYASVTNPDSNLFDLANIKYGVFKKENIESANSLRNYSIVFEDKSVVVAKNNNSFERSFITEDTVFLNSNLEDLLTYRPNVSSISKLNYSNNEVSIKAYSDSRDSHLFLSDTYFPGWKAYVNGKEVKINKTAHVFRSVKIDKGESEIKFVYDPISFKIGFFLSSIMGVFLIALILRHESSNT